MNLLIACRPVTEQASPVARFLWTVGLTRSADLLATSFSIMPSRILTEENASDLLCLGRVLGNGLTDNVAGNPVEVVMKLFAKCPKLGS